MCRSIKKLFIDKNPATNEEIHGASLQFVRKVSGYRKPSKINTAAFEKAVEQIAKDTQVLLDSLS